MLFLLICSIAAFTRINVPKLNSGEGNVYSGYLLPWMEEKDQKTGLVGKPEKGSKSKERQRNPKRVGAMFAAARRNEVDVGSDWLPNFGSVWQAGARSVTRREFWGNVSLFVLLLCVVDMLLLI